MRTGPILFGLRHYQDAAQKSVAITAVMFVDPKSGYTNGVSWPVFIGVTNHGPAEGKNISAHLQVVNPQQIRHASPWVRDTPAGTSVDVSAHGHGDEYIINIKNFVADTSVIIEIEFRAESESVKQEFINKFKADPLSDVFLAEFIKDLSFSGEGVNSEIIVGSLPPVAQWNGFEVLRNRNR